MPPFIFYSAFNNWFFLFLLHLGDLWKHYQTKSVQPWLNPWSLRAFSVFLTGLIKTVLSFAASLSLSDPSSSMATITGGYLGSTGPGQIFTGAPLSIKMQIKARYPGGNENTMKMLALCSCIHRASCLKLDFFFFYTTGRVRVSDENLMLPRRSHEKDVWLVERGSERSEWSAVCKLKVFLGPGQQCW